MRGKLGNYHLAMFVVIGSVVKDATLKRTMSVPNFTLNYQQYAVLTAYLQIQVTEYLAKSA